MDGEGKHWLPSLRVGVLQGTPVPHLAVRSQRCCFSSHRVAFGHSSLGSGPLCHPAIVFHSGGTGRVRTDGAIPANAVRQEKETKADREGRGETAYDDRITSAHPEELAEESISNHRRLKCEESTTLLHTGNEQVEFEIENRHLHQHLLKKSNTKYKCKISTRYSCMRKPQNSDETNPGRAKLVERPVSPRRQPSQQSTDAVQWQRQVQQVTL